jgi:hypothetical protein
MSWNFCESKKVTTRKPHKCSYCNREIPKGSKNIFTWWGMWEGEFQKNSYACAWCYAHKEQLEEDDGTIADFWDCLWYIFKKTIHELEEKHNCHVESDLEGEYMIFKNYCTKEELHRVHMPYEKIN